MNRSFLHAFACATLAVAVCGVASSGCGPQRVKIEDARAIPMNSQNQDLSTLSDGDLRKQLTPEQYNVCRQNGTEPPFRNAYWDNHEPGIYVDVISGEALFASTHKFDSGTGWPSFWEPIDKDSVVEKRDTSHGMVRVEVRSKKSDAHLGHVFDDGPKPTGIRYCINSASLRFIPKAKLQEAGYGQYLALFEGADSK